jgi:TRAP-type C4-dicarboxylate transport system permease small subunit
MAEEDDKPKGAKSNGASPKGELPESKEPEKKEEEEAEAEAKPSSPWPSSRPPKAEAKDPPEDEKKAVAAAKTAKVEPDDPEKKAWGKPLDRIDRAWTKLEARLCAAVLVMMIVTLVFWIAMKAMSSTGRDGYGQLFRSMITSLAVGMIVHFATRKQSTKVHHTASTIAAVVGWILGKFWGDAGVEYFSNYLAWMQNASLLVFFGGVSELAKRLTLWLALLGASIATAQGKHINVDVVMRFLSPKARVPVAILGWLTAAVVSGAAAWGFFDDVAVEEFHAPASMPCPPGDARKICSAAPGTKVDRVMHDIGTDMFLVGKQISLDLRTFPKVLGGTPYGKTMTPKEWNAWLREGDWEKRFPAEDVKALELPDDGSIEWRTPAVTSIPGGTEKIHMLMVPVLNLVFPFGLLVIAIRFVLRTLLALSGWVKVDPNAAHGDEELAHIHDHSAQAESVEAAIKETVR